MKGSHSIHALCCAAVLGLGPGCDDPPEPQLALSFVPEHQDKRIALGLESYVDLPTVARDDQGMPTHVHDFEGTTLDIQAEGGVEVLWTETMPTSLSGRTFHRIHYRCGEDASAEQRLDVKVVSQGETRYEGSYSPPCQAATSFRFEQGFSGNYVLGVLRSAIPRLTAGTQQLEGRGIRQVDLEGPVISLPGTANHFFYVRMVRPGKGTRFRAGPLELEVPITVLSDDQFSFRVEPYEVTYNGVYVMGFAGRGLTPDGSPVQGLADCEMTVSPANARYVPPDTGRDCTLYTVPGRAAQVCMTYHGKRSCSTYNP